ncbi:MAG TPA: ferritin [Anaerolineae bacterium]|nr:ferritin [Anaerolineae bacterium]
MLNKTVQDAINEQIKNEVFSAYLYLSMSGYFEHRNLPGFARWMRAQYEEELGHALKFFDFVNDRGGKVTLYAIDQPTTDFESPLSVFEHALEHEQKVTGMINSLYALAVKENDYPAQVLLQWYINEQVEEEKNATNIVEQLKLIGKDGSALLILDRELGARKAEADTNMGTGVDVT